MQVFTVGYGNRAIGDFVQLLQRYQIVCLVDTRSIPYSRFRPDYRKQALQAHLKNAAIEYLYLGDALGGKRVDPQFIVDGKVNLDQLMESEAFRTAMDQVESEVRAGKILVLMCAELRPSECHRAWMLAPALDARGIEVLHIDENDALRTQQEVRGWFGDA